MITNDFCCFAGNDLQWFDINHVSGLITTRLNIDRETQAQLQLVVSARDGGTSPKFATATVAITVEDGQFEIFSLQYLEIFSLQRTTSGRSSCTRRTES